MNFARTLLLILLVGAIIYAPARAWSQERETGSGDSDFPIGQERALDRHLRDSDVESTPLATLLAHGREIFAASWTIEDGAGRPLSKGTGGDLIDPSEPLVFPRNFNRVSGPDANSCAGCHNLPHGIPGGSGDFAANVFVLGQRFDFATFDPTDPIPTRSGVDERGQPATLETIANERVTIGMFGSGYIEMLARQMTAELQAIRDALEPGERARLMASGVSFGQLVRDSAGKWDTSQVQGLSYKSLVSGGPNDPPTLILRPFHQSGSVISLREFTSSAFNHHHGIQAAERFGDDEDPDGDGVVNELTRADITAVTLYQATLPVPGRVIPNQLAIEEAVLVGEMRFESIGCTSCHVPTLDLMDEGWIFSEPNPYNPVRNLRPRDGMSVSVDLSDPELPGPRLPVADGVVQVPAYTDLKLHDITAGSQDPNREPLDLNQAGDGTMLLDGNQVFLTARLWGAANQPPYFHHGKFTTLREAILAHAGEAEESRLAFQALTPYEQDAIVEFLKTLQILPPGSTHLVVDEDGNPKEWPPLGATESTTGPIIESVWP